MTYNFKPVINDDRYMQINHERQIRASWHLGLLHDDGSHST
jgi:hypothetical protein